MDPPAYTPLMAPGFVRLPHATLFSNDFIITGEQMAEAEDHFTVPEGIFAESCPTCDDIAADIPFTIGEEYPHGWKLVACRRHATILKDKHDDIRYVGGKPELGSQAAARYYSRLREQKDKNKTEAKAEAKAEAQAEVQGEAHVEADLTTTPPTDEICPICVDATAKFKIDCGHSFCAPCITEWQKNYTDEKLADWLEDCPDVLEEYRILKAYQVISPWQEGLE
ncbi:hypothetical protein E4T39_04594 [Aureobasidium subglaciale]|nr:hypothetical protein E4T39_04594 [Aureobasidium subglaciale]